MKESDLYLPLKQYLAAQGYTIKGEVGSCDVFAVRDTEPPVVVELKLSLNLTVILQAVDRLALTSSVYIGVPHRCGALKHKSKPIRKLLKMLGIGLIAINPDGKAVRVKVLLDPGEYRPRVVKHRQVRLLGEFEKRVGDPNPGGTPSRNGILTAYRQKAITVAQFLDRQGPTRAAEVAHHTQESKARDILYRDVYGWFDKVSRGVYTLSPRGKRELGSWLRADQI